MMSDEEFANLLRGSFLVDKDMIPKVEALFYKWSLVSDKDFLTRCGISSKGLKLDL